MRPRGKLIQFQLQTRDRGPGRAKAQARGLALDHYIEMIVRTHTVEQVRQGSVVEAIDRIWGLRKGSELSGLKIKDLSTRAINTDGDVRCGRLGDSGLVF